MDENFDLFKFESEDTLTVIKYRLYKMITTKNHVLSECIADTIRDSPMITNTSKRKIKSILKKIESTIAAEPDLHNYLNGIPINNLKFVSKVKLSKKEFQNLKLNYFQNEILNSYNIKARILDYELLNEKKRESNYSI